MMRTTRLSAMPAASSGPIGFILVLFLRSTCSPSITVPRGTRRSVVPLPLFLGMGDLGRRYSLFCAVLAQEGDEFLIIELLGHLERGAAGLIRNVGVCARVDEDFGDADLVVLGGDQQCGASPFVTYVQVGMSGD